MSRPLSDIEKAFWMVDQEVRQNFVIVAHLSHESGPLEGPLLRKALDLVQMRYPPLKWKIKEGEVPEFISDNVPPIPMHIIERKGDDQWIEECEKEMDKVFPFTKGPLLRVVLLASQKKSDLLVTFCHIASDGISGIIVMKKLLSILGKLLRGETVAPEPPLPVPPSSVDVLRKKLESNTRAPDTTDSADHDGQQSVELPPDEDVPPEKRTTRIIHRIISSTETKKLVSRCKTENTSVNAALYTAFLQTVVEQVRKSVELNVDKKNPLMISAITPVNIRHLLDNAAKENIGYYISFAIHKQLVHENESFWNAARNIRAIIQEEIDSGRHIEAILGIGEELKKFSIPIDLVRAIHYSNPPVAITNLGTLDIPGKYGDLTLEGINACGAIHFDTKSGFAILALTFNGCFNLNFLYAEPYISKRRAELMAESTMKRLRKAIRG